MRLPRNWTTHVAVGVALLLGGYVALFEAGGDPRLVPAGAYEVRTLTITGSEEGPIRLARRDGQWRLVRPLAWPADRLTAGELVRRLTEAQAERDLGPLSGEAADRYGLAEPYRHFTLQTAEAEHELRLGDPTPGGGARYATAGERVVTLDRSTVATLEKGLTDLRGKEVLSFRPDAVEAITVAGADHPRARLERGEHGDWHLTAPFRDDASDATARRLLADLANLRARGFHDGTALDSPELGLDRPLWRLRLTGEDLDGERGIRLAPRQGDEGGPRAAEAFVAATPTHADTAFDVRFSALNTREDLILQLVERQLFDVQAAAMGEIRLRRADGGGWTLARADDAGDDSGPTWQPKEGEGEVNASAVRRLAKALRNLRADSVTAGGSVTEPALRLRVERLDRDRPLELRLGPSEGGGPVPAATGHRAHRYTLPAEQVAGLNKALAALSGPH